MYLVIVLLAHYHLLSLVFPYPNRALVIIAMHNTLFVQVSHVTNKPVLSLFLCFHTF